MNKSNYIKKSNILLLVNLIFFYFYLLINLFINKISFFLNKVKRKMAEGKENWAVDELLKAEEDANLIIKNA